jgi:cytochrome c-type biogenesis protein
MGIAFAFGWTPCVGPILGGILTISASSLSAADGVILLSIYSAGLTIPFVLVAVFTNQFLRRSTIMKRIGRRLQMVAGGILVLVGVSMATRHITSASTWMLNTFPFLQSLVF